MGKFSINTLSIILTFGKKQVNMYFKIKGILFLTFIEPALNAVWSNN